uniref:Uncharacterized protein n=1 Tax=Setaria italica TaxID=4555 RepID=K3YEZ6_SETIT
MNLLLHGWMMKMSEQQFMPNRGDHDLCIPFPGTEAWVRSIGYQVVDRWRPWYFGDQVAGYAEGYDHNLTFLTIKGAGHAVPEYKPKESLAFYSRWLAGEKF